MITRIKVKCIKVKCRKTFVFNERGNRNPDGFIHVNTYDLGEAYRIAKSKFGDDIILVDVYYLKKKPQRRYNSVPDWAV